MTPAGLCGSRWPSAGGEEFALVADGARGPARRGRLLIIPALFNEANRLRRFTVEVMRRLDGAGLDVFLPDLPGCNDSLAPLETQTLAGWRAAIADAARHFRAGHALAIRGGALLAPSALPGWTYAGVSGEALLRQLLRARVLAAREAGAPESSEALLALGRTEGLELAGYRLGAAMIAELEARPAAAPNLFAIPQDLIGGAGLWLRAEPGEDRAQADALAAVVAMGFAP